MIRLLHRGDTKFFIENTLLAIEYSLRNNNYNGFETDLKLSKDNQWVIFHDNNLERLCNNKRNLHDVNYKEMPLIKNKYKIPKFTDLLKFNNKYDSNKIFNLEIKEDFNIGDNLKKNLLENIKKIKYDVIVSSFHWEWYDFFNNNNIKFGHLIENNKLPDYGDLWIADYNLINQKLIKKCKLNNIKLGCYTLNKNNNFNYIIDLEIWDN